MTTREPALQDAVQWQCFACGSLHERGLRIRSHAAGEEFVCRWQPDPLYVGHPGRLHAGLAATVMMCHMVWSATAVAHRREGRALRDPIDFTYGTKSFRMDLLKPFPIQRPVTFGARVGEMRGERATVLCSAEVDGEVHCRAEADLFRFNPAN